MIHVIIMVLNPRKCYYMSYRLNISKNQFILPYSISIYSHLKQLYKKVANKLKVLIMFFPFLLDN